ncbi:MAG: hypothetical protein ACU0BS_03725 [Hasllibacter sp.]
MSVLTGFVLGLLAAAAALATGWGILAALGLYSGIGVAGTLAGAAIATLPRPAAEGAARIA